MSMQIVRLFEIVYLLLEKKSVTASELADRFEVSTRTIYRDIDTLSAAGIPVYASKGKGGGLRLTEGFVLNKSLLSETEQNEILTALQALGATQYPGGAEILGKLGALFQKSTVNWIDVDFSDWGFSDRETFDILKRAILERRRVAFDYYSSYGEKTIRTAEPLLLWFKHRSWYLKAYDCAKQDERTFKLSRLKRLNLLDETFDPSTHPEKPYTPPDKRQASMVRIRLRVDASQLYRIYDEFDESMIEKSPDDEFLCEAVFPEDEWVYGFILSFGHFAEVLEPPHIREIIAERARKISQLYSE